MVIKALIWDEKNTDHIRKHQIETREVKEAVSAILEVRESYRKRLLIIGKTKRGRILAVVVSPEDGKLKAYEPGVYCVITTFDYKE
jgi:uncharacterized DUF497 family protein